jgi:uncharacterized membrane protein YhaH (DUF805 family)
MLEWMLLPLKRYADFSGRSRRKEYWMFMLLNFVIYLVLLSFMLAGGFSLAAMGDPAAVPQAPGALFWVGAGLLGIWGLAIMIPSIAVAVRRLHDRDMSGWFFLLFIVLSLIPLVGILVSIGWLVLMCLEGTSGPNKYGADPKDPTSAGVFS